MLRVGQRHSRTVSKSPVRWRVRIPVPAKTGWGWSSSTAPISWGTSWKAAPPNKGSAGAVMLQADHEMFSWDQHESMVSVAYTIGRAVWMMISGTRQIVSKHRRFCRAVSPFFRVTVVSWEPAGPVDLHLDRTEVVVRRGFNVAGFDLLIGVQSGCLGWRS